VPGTSSGEANQSWKRRKNAVGAFAGFVDVTGDLAQGTKDNEALRVFTASGYYDLATAYFANAYMLHHSGVDPARGARHGGHLGRSCRIVQSVPNRSRNCANRVAKNVSAIGILTSPPSARAL
jgi:hypothetical protein